MEGIAFMWCLESHMIHVSAPFLDIEVFHNDVDVEQLPAIEAFRLTREPKDSIHWRN